MVRIGADAGDHLGVARLHRARRAAHRDDTARAAERNVVEPSHGDPQMLRQADRRIRRQREAADGLGRRFGLRNFCCAEQVREVRGRETSARS